MKYRQGVADRSYGIQVARLAGLPAHGKSRARPAKVLSIPRKKNRPAASGDAAPLLDDLAVVSRPSSSSPATQGWATRLPSALQPSGRNG